MLNDYDFVVDFKINKGNDPSYEESRNLFVVVNDELILFKFELFLT